MLTMQQLQNFRQHAKFEEIFTAEAQEWCNSITEAGAYSDGSCTIFGKSGSKHPTLSPGQHWQQSAPGA